jgi:hypothetical protein
MTPEAIKPPVMIPLVVILILVLGGFIFATYLHEKDGIEKEVSNRIDGLEQLLEAHIEEDFEMISTAILTLSQGDEFLAALKAGVREELITRYSPLFKRLYNETEITHFYFTGPDRVNIVRLHKPDRFGDVIDRFSTLEAERTGKPANGLELGPLGTFTMRVVHPFFDGDQLIGYVELGHEMNHLVEMVARILGVDLLVLIRKEFLVKEDWLAGMQMLGRAGEWDRFPDTVSINRIPDGIPDAFLSLLTSNEIDALPDDIEIESDGRNCRFRHIPLADVAGQNSGRLVVMLDMTESTEASVRFVFTVALVSVTVGCLILIFFCMYLGWLDRKKDEAA